MTAEPDHSDLPLNITLTGHAAARVRRRAAITGMSLEAVAEEAVADELGRSTYDALFRSRAEHITTLDGWAKRLAEIALALGGMPRTDAAAIVAAAQDHLSDDLKDDVRAAHLRNLTSLWSGRTTAWGKRSDGSHGPTETTTYSFDVTPEQYDALQRIGHPATDGGQRVLDVALPRLDPAPGAVYSPLKQRRMTAAVTRHDDDTYSALCVDLHVMCTGESAKAAVDTLRDAVTSLVLNTPTLLDRWPVIEPFEVAATDAVVRLAAVFDKDDTAHWHAREPITKLKASHATRHGAREALHRALERHASQHGLPHVELIPIDIPYPQAWLDKEAERHQASMSPEARQAAYARFYKDAEA
ncbi:hypothetical protein ACWGCW_12825 [Streptomyces sp. NPDC054933]